MTLTGEQVAAAVYADHPCEGENTCDIAAALEAGFPFVAAHLLCGATETPALDAIGYVDQREPEGWDEWVVYFKANTVRCDCGSFVFREEDYAAAEQVCGNCLAIVVLTEEALMEEAEPELEANPAQLTIDPSPAEVESCLRAMETRDREAGQW